MKRSKPVRHRSPSAKALESMAHRQRVVPDRRSKLLAKVHDKLALEFDPDMHIDRLLYHWYCLGA